jgi:hypothetical protein
MEIKEMRVIKDGNAWCFILPDFENLQVSPSVWTDPGDMDIDAVYAQLIGEDNFFGDNDHEHDDRIL